MNLVLRYFLLLSLGLVLGLQLAIGQNESTAVPDGDQQNLPLEELRLFTEVFAKVKSDYVESVSDKDLLENGIRGMLAGLDPHSAYLSPSEYKNLQEGTSGQFGGLGIEVGSEDGFLKVISPIDDTPAQKAGIQAGDLIIKINETPTKGMTLNQAVDLMRGKPGSEITLLIMRQGAEKPMTFTIKRDVIKVESVKGRTLEAGFGYVRIAQFQQHTGEDLVRIVDKLKQENGDKLKGLILDLRNDPGGVLNAAVEVCDAFMERGKIVYTEGRVKDSQLEFSAKPGDLLKGAPMVVLINGGSASASEIVAGALQDSQRAVIMGTQSFGKGSVQTILPMNNGAAVKLTTARYFTPLGRSIQAQGIIPDVPLKNVKLAEGDGEPDAGIKEKDLSHHLQNQTTKPQGGGAQSGKANGALDKDYDVLSALNMLRGMALLQERR